MNTNRATIISLLIFLALAGKAQRVVAVYKTSDLLKRIDTSSVPLIVNFWATWCAPCVKELAAFDSLSEANHHVKVLLVSLDFKEDIDKKVDPFLKNKRILNECILLDEINGNDYISKVSAEWNGAIPATLIKNGDKILFFEKKLQLSDLVKALASIER